MRTSGILLLLLVVTLAGCASVPPESVLLSQQVEKNLKTLKANNLTLLKAWRDLSIDYWSEKVARDGPDIILEKARKAGQSIDLTKDYRDLVAAVMNQYRNNFLNKIEDVYTQYVDKINKDFDQTEDAQRQLSALLQSIVKLNAERDRIFRTATKELGIDDTVTKLQQELKDATK